MATQGSSHMLPLELQQTADCMTPIDTPSSASPSCFFSLSTTQHRRYGVCHLDCHVVANNHYSSTGKINDQVAISKIAQVY